MKHTLLTLLATLPLTLQCALPIASAQAPSPGAESTSSRPRDQTSARDTDVELALETVLVSGSPRGVPILQRILAGAYSPEIQSRALFVMLQIDPAAAEAAIEGIVAGDGPAELKREAFAVLGVGGRPESHQRMVTLLPQIDDPEVRSGIVTALLTAGRADLLLEVARKAPDAQTRHRALQALGAIGGVSELAALYSSLKDADERREVLHALGVSGAVPQLESIAKSESDPELRAEAIRALGVSGGDAGRAGILAAFRSASSEAVRRSAIEALIISGATDELIQLYRESDSQETRRELIRAISAVDPDRAIDMIEETLR